MIDIDFSLYQEHLQIRRMDGKRYIYDPIRKKYLVLSPEEMVRQLVIAYLIHERAYNNTRISIEKTLIINGLNKRFDVLIYQNNLAPYLLIECKAPAVSIQQATFEQIARYNMALKVPYLLVTNGHQTFCCAINYETEDFEFLEAIPDYPLTD